MKILISCDMEGITGVTSWEHVDPSRPEYQRFRYLMTWDANSAIEGAISGGADEVVVTDGHWNGSNILIEELDKRVKLNSGIGTSQFSMMQGIDDSFDGVFFIGYHARAGSEYGILDHTWSTNIINLWLNDVLVGEYGLNAAMQGFLAFVSWMRLRPRTSRSDEWSKRLKSRKCLVNWISILNSRE